MYEKNKKNRIKKDKKKNNSILKKFKSLFGWDEKKRNSKRI
jgi:hypothetical protein